VIGREHDQADRRARRDAAVERVGDVLPVDAEILIGRGDGDP
jgi:hypothetical protein